MLNSEDPEYCSPISDAAFPRAVVSIFASCIHLNNRMSMGSNPAGVPGDSLSAYSYFLRKPVGELGGETDQLSDGGRALDVYGMHRSHQVVGSQAELLGDRGLTSRRCRRIWPLSTQPSLRLTASDAGLSRNAADVISSAPR